MSHVRRRIRQGSAVWYLSIAICLCAVLQPAGLITAMAAHRETDGQGSQPTIDCLEIAGVEKLMSKLSEITGEWPTLGEDLGVPRSKIEAIKLDEPNTESKRRAVLRAWYDSQEQPCWEPVIKVLKGMGRNRLAGNIEKCISKGCDCELVQCSMTRDTEFAIGSTVQNGLWPIATTSLLGFGVLLYMYFRWKDKSPMARYADYLKAYYRTAPVAPDIPECCKWPPTPSTQYINLAVAKKEDVSRAEADRFTRDTLHGNIDKILKVKKPIQMEDVLVPEGEAELKCVLVEGAPGVGKSTFAWEFCRRWDEIEAMRKYSVVVLLRLREKRVQEAKTVADLFYHDNPSIQQAVAEEITSNGGASTLLVLDGFDEVPASVQKSSLLVQIIRGVCLPKATVLVTSRPSARLDLQFVCKPQVHKHIEVLGFTDKLIEEYASSIFACNPLLLADFRKYISVNPAIKSMMCVPLNSAIVVEIYRENRTVGRPIPQTMTQLYNELTLTLLGRYLSEKGEQPVLPDKLEDLPQNLYQQLLSLAKLAFEGIVKQEVIFDRLPDGCSPLGLMNASAELYVRGRSVNFNFLHLTLQEFLSAFYISQLSSSEQKAMFERYSEVAMDEVAMDVVVVEGNRDVSSGVVKKTFSHMDMVWRFVAGLIGFKDIGWDVVQSRMGRNKWGCVTPFLVHCLYEAPEEVDCESVLGKSAVGIVLTTPFDCFAVGYCIAVSKCAWGLSLNSGTVEMVEMLVCGLKSKEEVQGSIDSLGFSISSTLKQEGMAHLKEMPHRVLQQISILDLLSCELDRAALDLLSDIIPIMTSLRNLNISWNPVGDGGTVKLLQALGNLHSLVMNYTYIGCDDITALSQLIRPTGCLKELWSGDQDMPPECVELMMKTVLSPSSLEELVVLYVDLTSCHNCFSLLAENHNLTTLRLIGCVTDEETISCLSEALHSNTTLEFLTIDTSDLHVTTLQTLINSLQYNHTLKQLRLPEKCEHVLAGVVLDSRVEWYGVVGDSHVEWH